MSIRSGTTKSHESGTATMIIENLLSGMSPKSFSSNELDDVLALSDDDGTSTMNQNDDTNTINTNGNNSNTNQKTEIKQQQQSKKKKLPIWIKNIGKKELDEDKTTSLLDVSSGTKQHGVDADAAKAAAEAAAAAADALGKDLEAMGYDLECRSFIKMRSQDSVIASPMSTKDGKDTERYTSTNTVAPFSDDDDNQNNNTVLELLRSSSDLIEATRSSSDLIEALRSKSSDDQHLNELDAPLRSLLSSGTGPMLGLPEDDDEKEQDDHLQPMESWNNKSMSSRISRHSMDGRSQRSEKSHHTNKSYRSQKTNTTSASKSRRVKGTIQVDQVPPELLAKESRKQSDPVVIETVTSIPSTLSQYNIQYTTTTNSGDGGEQLLLITSPSYHHRAANNTNQHDNNNVVMLNTETVVPDSTLDTATKIDKVGKVTVPAVADEKKSFIRRKSKGLSKNLETGTYHGASAMKSKEIANNDESSKDGSSDRLASIVRCASEGGKLDLDPSKKRSKIEQRQRVSRIVGTSQKDHGTVKSRSSYWSRKVGGSRKTWSGHINRAPTDHDNDDDASEASSVATSRVAPPFQELSIPMKKKKATSSTIEIKEIATEKNVGSERPPRIPNASSSQHSKVSTSSSKKDNKNVVSADQPGFIETKRSVDSRTVNETSPDEIEATAERKMEPVAVDHINAVEQNDFVEGVITTAPSVESKSSVKKMLKVFSIGSKDSAVKNIKSYQSGPVESNVKIVTDNDETSAVEKFASPTSNISIECDDEQKAREQEQIARELILANMVERQRRLRRSMEAREKILKLVQDKDAMTLPPTFGNSPATMVSAANTAPAKIDCQDPLIVPPSTTSLTTMPRAAPFFSAEGSDNQVEKECEDSVVSDATPKVRGSARILNFLSFSPEKRPRVAKVKKLQQAPISKVKLIPAPMFGRRRSSTKQTSRPAQLGLDEKSKKVKQSSNRRSMFSLMRADKSKSKSATHAKEIIANETIKTEPPLDLPIVEQPIVETPILPKKPKVSYVDLDEEAIEVAFSKSPDSMCANLPSMFGADAVLEKIDEEESHDDMKSQTSGAEGAPLYNVQPLMITPITSVPNPMNEDMLTLTRKAAVEDLKKVGASMIATTQDAPRTTEQSLITETLDSPERPQATSFFTVVDKWFFESLNGKSATIKKEEAATSEVEAFPSDLVKAGKEMTEKVLSGFTFTKPTGEKSTKEIEPRDAISPTTKDREKTLEYLDQELKSREENSLKSITELEEKVLQGSALYERAIPTHLTFHEAIPDDGSCLTALNSTLTRTETHGLTRDFTSRKDDVSSLSDVLTMDQWNEIAEAAFIVERALKNIERSGGLKSTKSEGINSKPSFAFVNEEVEESLRILSKHATRLGVSESDILMALGGSYEDESLAEPPSILAQQLSQSPGPRTRPATSEYDDGDTATMESTKSLTIGEEILEALQMYMAKK